jgi:hypothetical protein
MAPHLKKVRTYHMPKKENNLDDAINQFKNTIDDLRSKKMIDEAAFKWERERKQHKENPFKKKEASKNT